MNDEDDPITTTVRCRVNDCPYQKTYPPEKPSDLIPHEVPSPESQTRGKDPLPR